MSTTTEINLATFCGESSFYALAAPFVFNGYRYALDGKLCVRIKAPLELDTTFDKKISRRPPVDTLDFSKCANASVAYPGDSSETFGKANCETCLGDGSVGKTICPKCDGELTVDCRECGQERECPRCHGIGSITGGTTCASCNGTKQTHQKLNRQFDIFSVSPQLDAKLSQLPNLKYCPPAIGDRIVCFRFDGGEGLFAILTIVKEEVLDTKSTP